MGPTSKFGRKAVPKTNQSHYLAVDEWLLKYGAITPEQYRVRKAQARARKYVKRILPGSVVTTQVELKLTFQEISIACSKKVRRAK